MKKIKIFLFVIWGLLSVWLCTPSSDTVTGEKDTPEITLPERLNFLVYEYFQLNSILPLGDGFVHVNNYWGDPFYAVYLGYDAKRLSEDERRSYYRLTGEDNLDNRFEHFDAEPPEAALAEMIDRIDVISSSDFNGIPPGESLAGKFRFYSASAWPTIQSGRSIWIKETQTEFCQRFNYYPFYHQYAPIQGLLSDHAPQDFYLLDYHGDKHPGAILVVDEIPEIKEHVFTISYYEGHKVWSVDVPAKFD